MASSEVDPNTINFHGVEIGAVLVTILEMNERQGLKGE